jgi:hypothetical protein
MSNTKRSTIKDTLIAVIPQSPSAQDHKGIESLPQNINNLLVPPAIKVLLILLQTEMLQPNISQKRTRISEQRHQTAAGG